MPEQEAALAQLAREMADATGIPVAEIEAQLRQGANDAHQENEHAAREGDGDEEEDDFVFHADDADYEADADAAMHDANRAQGIHTGYACDVDPEADPIVGVRYHKIDSDPSYDVCQHVFDGLPPEEQQLYQAVPSHVDMDLLPGSVVRVRREITEPRFGWADATHSSIALLRTRMVTDECIVAMVAEGTPSWDSIACELEVVPDAENPQISETGFRVGDFIRIRQSVTTPELGWGALERCKYAIGRIAAWGGNDRMTAQGQPSDAVVLNCYFPCVNVMWNGLASELELAEEALAVARIGARVQVRRAVVEPRAGWPDGVTHRSVGVVRRVLFHGLVKVVFPDTDADAHPIGYWYDFDLHELVAQGAAGSVPAATPAAAADGPAADLTPREPREHCVYMLAGTSGPARVVAAAGGELGSNAAGRAFLQLTPHLTEALGSDGNGGSLGWSDRGWRNEGQLFSELRAGLGRNQRGLVARAQTRAEADGLVSKLTSLGHTCECVHDANPETLLVARAIPPRHGDGVRDTGGEEELRLADRSVDMCRGGPKGFSVLVHVSPAVGPLGGGIGEGELMQLLSATPSLYDILKRRDATPRLGESSHNYAWTTRGFEGGEDNWTAISLATTRAQPPLPLVIARKQTRRAAHLLRARIGTLAGFVASVHGEGEEAELSTIGDLSTAMEVGEASFAMHASGVVGANPTGRVQTLLTEAGSAQRLSHLRGLVSYQPLGVCDPAVMPVRRLQLTNQLRGVLEKQVGIVQLIAAYITLGEGCVTRGVMELEMSVLPNMDKNGWHIKDAVSLMRRGERSVWALLSTTPNDSGSQGLIEELWRNVVAAEAVGRVFPPHPQVEAHLKSMRLQLGMHHAIDLILQGGEADWASMMSGWVETEESNGWHLTEGIRKMADGERRATHLLLDTDPCSDGVLDIILHEVISREAEGTRGSARASSRSVALALEGANRPRRSHATKGAHAEGVNETIANPQQHLSEALLCPLTLTIMEDPVMAMDGVTYERQAITAYFRHERAQGRMPRSPLSRQTIPSEQLLPNRALKAVIQAHRCLQREAKPNDDEPPKLSRGNSSVSGRSTSRSVSRADAEPGMLRRWNSSASIGSAAPNGLARAGSEGSVLMRGGPDGGAVLIRQQTSRSVRFADAPAAATSRRDSILGPPTAAVTQPSAMAAATPSSSAAGGGVGAASVEQVALTVTNAAHSPPKKGMLGFFLRRGK